MKLSFHLPDDGIFSLDVPPDTRMNLVRLMVAIEASVNEKEILLMKEGHSLPINEQNTVHDCKLAENDLLMVVVNRPEFPAPRFPDNVSVIGSDYGFRILVHWYQTLWYITNPQPPAPQTPKT